MFIKKTNEGLEKVKGIKMKPINSILILLFSLCIYSCNQSPTATDLLISDTVKAKTEIVAMLDSFNMAAANADYKTYFNFYTSDAIFTGTDATERWTKNNFMQWAKPYFDKKTTWNFTALQRNVYFDEAGSLAWFDELLKTQMSICRGSGVLVKEANGWKLKQYILSTMVPNELIDSVTKMKIPLEEKLIQKLSNK